MQWLKAVVLRLEHASNPQEDLLKHRLLGTNPRVSDSEGLASGLKMCISTKFPGDANVAGPERTL